MSQPKAAIENRDRRHADDNEGDNVIDADGGLIEYTGTEVDSRSANIVHSVSYALADHRRVTPRVVAVLRVNQD